MSSDLAWIVVGFAAIAALVLVLGWISYRGMIHYRIRDEGWLLGEGLRSGDFDGSALDLPWIEEDLASPTGYCLRVHALDGGTGRVALFHHGIGAGWMSMLRYMMLFRAGGWTVVAFDSRGHGNSGGGRPSYGYYEKADLKAVADWALARFAAATFVVFGESMGAATVLQYAPLDPRIEAVIADCPFSSALGELDHRLKAAFVPKPFRALASLAADSFCRRLEGFSLAEADPSAAILDTEVPILFIHGLEDRFVPWRMSMVMAETRRRKLPKARTELLLVPGAKHASSIRADRARYAEALQSFLDEALGPASGGA
jgi:pimeloyl-ACP methyl ester carboxylesterase